MDAVVIRQWLGLGHLKTHSVLCLGLGWGNSNSWGASNISIFMWSLQYGDFKAARLQGWPRQQCSGVACTSSSGLWVIIQGLYVGSLQSAMGGVFTPQKSANITNPDFLLPREPFVKHSAVHHWIVDSQSSRPESQAERRYPVITWPWKSLRNVTSAVTKAHVKARGVSSTS